MTTTIVSNTINTDHLTNELKTKIPSAFCNFIDIVESATNRATFYNSKEEQQKAVEQVHRDLFEIDRGLYGLGLLLPGINDYAKQLGMGFLLDNPRTKQAIMNEEQEAKLIAYLAQFMPPQRLFKLYRDLRQNRVNNAKTRKLILRSILRSPKLELWSVKYRYKIRQALTHAWGNKVAAAMRAILGKKYSEHEFTFTDKENDGLRQHIQKYTEHPDVLECVAFILGHENNVSLPLFKAYRDAKKDIKKGKGLPEENLEYIRNRFHPKITRKEVLELTKDTMSEGKKMSLQKKAKEAGITIEFDPAAADAVRLYIYAYEMGMDDKIEAELKKKAKKSADTMLARYKNVGIVIDPSLSMRGHGTQKNRPIAVALATRDMLVAGSDKAIVDYCDGRPHRGLIIPAGDTSLSGGLVRVLKMNPEAVFVITDGYENAPAGRFAETIEAVRKIGINTPIFQVSMVTASEKQGIRQLSSKVPAMPLSRPESINIAVIKSLLAADVERAILGLANMSLPRLGYTEVHNG